MRDIDVGKLYIKICQKAFKIDPFECQIKIKKLHKNLARADYMEDQRDGSVQQLVLRIDKRLLYSDKLVAQCLIHEISHLVSGDRGHGNKFYAAYFKAAQTKWAREFF